MSAFYSVDRPPPAKPGTMIRTEPLPASLMLPGAGSGQRILYSSTDGVEGHGAVAVSGAMFTPKSPPPPGGWPLIAWAHGTVGVADVCAPSWAARSARDTTYLNAWLREGYAVVATDYQGLGTPGGHPYLGTRAAAYSVLDSIRAVRSADSQIAEKAVIVGQSQGGGAAFAAVGVAPGYAPEVDIRGAVATGTPYFTPVGASAKGGVAATGGLAYQILTLYLARTADPNFRLADHVTPEAMPVVESAQRGCLSELTGAAQRARLTASRTFVGGVVAVLGPYLPLMGYDSLRVKGPVFLGTGGADTTVPAREQQRLARDACAAGSVIEQHIYPGLDHSTTVNGSAVDSVEFVARAFSGAPITGNCADLP